MPLSPTPIAATTPISTTSTSSEIDQRRDARPRRRRCDATMNGHRHGEERETGDPRGEELAEHDLAGRRERHLHRGERRGIPIAVDRVAAERRRDEHHQQQHDVDDDRVDAAPPTRPGTRRRGTTSTVTPSRSRRRRRRAARTRRRCAARCVSSSRTIVPIRSRFMRPPPATGRPARSRSAGGGGAAASRGRERRCSSEPCAGANSTTGDPPSPVRAVPAAACVVGPERHERGRHGRCATSRRAIRQRAATTASRSSSPARLAPARPRCVAGAAAPGRPSSPRRGTRRRRRPPRARTRMWLEIRIVRPSAASRRRSTRSSHARLRVESGGRLVEQQHLRVVHERASEPEPLLLPAREHAAPARRRARSSVHAGAAARWRALGGVRLRHPVQPRRHDERLARRQRRPRAERVRHPADEPRARPRVSITGRPRRRGCSPASGASSEASISSSVVLPEPFGPTSPVTRPGWRLEASTSRTAWTSPKERRTPQAAMPGAGHAPHSRDGWPANTEERDAEIGVVDEHAVDARHPASPPTPPPSRRTRRGRRGRGTARPGTCSRVGMSR